MGDVGVIKCRLDADVVRGGIELRSSWALVACRGRGGGGGGTVVNWR